MDIRNWPIDKILTLPDYCLSRRYSVFVALQTADILPIWDISELALPNRTIVHEMIIVVSGGFGLVADMRLALGDQLPTTIAQMDTLEPLFPGFGFHGPEPRIAQVSMPVTFTLRRLKMYVPAQGRRIILEGTSTAETGPSIHVGVVVSSVPTEVPEWVRLE